MDDDTLTLTLPENQFMNEILHLNWFFARSFVHFLLFFSSLSGV